MGVFSKAKDVKVEGRGTRNYPWTDGTVKARLLTTGHVEGREVDGLPTVYASWEVLEVLKDGAAKGCYRVGEIVDWTTVVPLGGKQNEMAIKAVKGFVMGFTGFESDLVDEDTINGFFGIGIEEPDPEEHAGMECVVNIVSNVSKKNGKTYFNDYYNPIVDPDAE